ncbi:MAG: DUF2089 domain-containing protein [Anaerolineaceae bacterium]|nr:DUF2089 domain-containing protein [Anaerolineaceae bacterium]
MNPLLSKCPVCGLELSVTRLHCDTCDTTIEGIFSSPSVPFAQLTPEQVQFVLTFVRCEGRFNRMEDELNLSYPTIRNRLYEIIRALGYEPGKEEIPVRLSAEERKRILDDVDNGKITPEQAQRLLQGLQA